MLKLVNGAHQPAIAFMAGILQDRLTFVLRQRHRKRPWRRPRFRIIDRDLIKQRIRLGAGEALDQAERVAHGDVAPVTAGPESAVEVGGFDDERITIPAAAGIAHVSPDGGREVRSSIERDESSLVDHLVANRHETGRLHDLIAVAVARWEHGRKQPA